MARMSVDHVANVLVTYLDEQIAPKAHGLQKLGTYMFGIAAAKQGANLVQQYVPTMQMLGVMDEQKMLDIDALADMARQAMGKMGNKFSAFGIIFDVADIDIIADIARRFSTI